MPTPLLLAELTSIIAFLAYGVACFCSSKLTAEFQRWGLAPIQKLTGALEVLGALGLMAGFWNPALRTLSAAGLTLMMVVAVGVRAKIRDPFLHWLPALGLLFLNLFILLSILLS
jgi:hypothetical protein